MSETPDSLIAYDEIVQDALRSVVKRVLSDVEGAGGLPGDHHFYIAFKTKAPGVDIPRHLVERYPDEMTVVIQHRYWDLSVDDERFQIGLTFNQVPAKLSVPWSAVSAASSTRRSISRCSSRLPTRAAEPEAPLEAVVTHTDGSNVVALDFKRKK